MLLMPGSASGPLVGEGRFWEGEGQIFEFFSEELQEPAIRLLG